MQTIQSPNPFPNPPKPKPNPTKQHRIPTQHPIFQKTQNTKPKKKKFKQTNIPITQKHNPTSKKFTKSQSLTNLSEENLRTYFTLCKNQQREREAKQKKPKTKKKTLNFWSSFENLRESKRVNLISMHFFFSLSLSLTLCEKKLEQCYTRLRSFFYLFLERERQRNRVKFFVCVTTLRHQKCGTYFC